jgi:methionine-gamma-lyase
MKEAGFATRAIHSGESSDPTTRAHNTPIYQTASFIFDHTTELVDAYDNPFDTFFYSREGNPTVAKLQDKISELTGGEACLATASGMAAISAAVMAVARCGDHILVSKEVLIALTRGLRLASWTYGICKRSKRPFARILN